MIKVTMTLNPCAIKNAKNGFLLCLENKSVKLVSSPILVNAKANHKPCKFLRLPFIVLIES